MLREDDEGFENLHAFEDPFAVIGIRVGNGCGVLEVFSLQDDQAATGIAGLVA